MNNNTKMTLVKICVKLSLAILLFGCMWDQPRTYYEILKSAAFVGFVSLIWMEYNTKSYHNIFICIAALALFNPFIQIKLQKDEWEPIDLITGIILIISIIIDFITITKKRRI